MSDKICDGCFWNDYQCEPTMFHGYSNGVYVEYDSAICDMYTPIDPDEELGGSVVIPYEEFREEWIRYLEEDDCGDDPVDISAAECDAGTEGVE